MSLQKAKQLIRIEARAVADLEKRIDRHFRRAADLLKTCRGRVVVSGMGKTGIIGRKIAATFSSTGTPSVYMHSAEAIHGDLGQVTKDDVLIVISNSGETEETIRLLPLLKRTGAKIIAMTGNAKSTLAKYSDVILNIGVKEEGCPLGLAPMASTTVALVMGDALAACLIVEKGFKKEHFALNHPGGSLGRRLLLKVHDVMRCDFPKVGETRRIQEVLLEITKHRCGSACVVGKNGRLSGIFTDGDLRRRLKEGTDILNRPVKDAMTKHPAVIREDRLAEEALRILQSKKIDELPVLNDKNKLVGLLDVQDLLKAGIM